MTGQVLDFAVQTNSGVISGDDGSRYHFAGDNWQDASVPQRGMRVDFIPSGDTATEIYAESRSVPQPTGDLPLAREYPKSKIAAGLLALLLGGWGIHKFYMGYVGAGIIHILITVTIIGIFVNWIICLIEGIIYLTKSDEDFHQTYVVNRKSFF